MRAKSFYADCAAFLALSLALGVTLLALMRGENSPALLAAVAGVILLALGVEVLIAGLVSWVLGQFATRIVWSLLAGLNGYSLYLVHLNQGLTFELAFTLGLAVVFGLMLAATAGTTFPRIAGTIVVAFLPAMSLWGNLAASSTGEKENPHLAGFRAIEFRDTPNIYLFSFDALMPSAAARKVLDIGPLVYEDWLRDNGALLAKNSFVTYTPSIPSLDAVMKLDDNLNFREEGYFAGRLPSPLSESLHANGYYIETGSSIPYYFGASGNSVDRHSYIAKNFILDNSLCKFAGLRTRLYGVFGFCRLDKYFETSAIFDQTSVAANPDEPYFDGHWHDYVLSRIASNPDRRRLMFYYYYYPIGHAPNDFISFDEAQMSEYRKRYLIQSDKAQETIVDLMDQVRRHDPGAIVLIFGDHGPKTSRTADWQEHTEYWVLDNHAVLFALMPSPHACARPDLGVYNQAYHTAGRIVASIMRCLAKDPAEVDAAVNFLDKFPFERYLYE